MRNARGPIFICHKSALDLCGFPKAPVRYQVRNNARMMESRIIMDDQPSKDAGGFLRLLKVLTPEQVLEVDRALAAIGPFGEVRLIKVKGRLRFIQQLESRDMLQSTKPR